MISTVILRDENDDTRTFETSYHLDLFYTPIGLKICSSFISVPKLKKIRNIIRRSSRSPKYALILQRPVRWLVYSVMINKWSLWKPHICSDWEHKNEWTLHSRDFWDCRSFHECVCVECEMDLSRNRNNCWTMRVTSLKLNGMEYNNLGCDFNSFF